MRLLAAAILLQSTLTFSLQTDDRRGVLWSGEGQMPVGNSLDLRTQIR